MEIDQLKGRCRRLKIELAIERQSHPCRSGLVSRLTRDIAWTENEITALEPLQRLPIGWFGAGRELQRAA